MKYFFELLDHFNRLNNKRILLEQEAVDQSVNTGSIVYTVGNINSIPKPLDSEGQAYLRSIGIQSPQPAINKQQAGQKPLQGRNQKGETVTVYVWKEQGDSQAEPLEKQDQQTQQPQPQEQLRGILPQDPRTAFISWAQGILSRANDNLARILPLEQLTLAWNQKGGELEKVLRALYKKDRGKYLSALRFFDLAGKNLLEQFQLIFTGGTNSLFNRLGAAKIVELNSDGTVNLGSELSLDDVGQDINRTLDIIFSKLNSEGQLSDDDRLYILDHVKVTRGIQSGESLVIKSDDGRFAVSIGLRGAGVVLGELIRSLYNGKVDDKNQIDDFQRLGVVAGAYSNVFGTIHEEMTALSVRIQTLKNFAKTCEADSKLSPQEKKLQCEEITRKLSFAEEKYAMNLRLLAENCKKLRELVKDGDLLGDTESINSILSLLKDIPKDDEKYFEKVTALVTALIESQPSLKYADWSVTVGGVKSAQRKGDVLSICFDEEKANKLTQSCGQKAIAYDLKNPEDIAELRSKFKEGDPQYQELIDLAISRGQDKLYIISPSLKATTLEDAETKLGTYSIDKSTDLAKFAMTTDENSLQEFVKSFNERYSALEGTLTISDARRLRETIRSRIDKAVEVAKEADSNIDAVAAQKAVAKEYEVLQRIQTLGPKITKTLGDTEIRVNSVDNALELLKSVGLDIGLGIESSDIKESELGDEFQSAIKAAKDASKNKDDNQAKQHIARAMNILANVKRRKRANSEDPAIRAQARLELYIDLQYKGGAHLDDQTVLKTSYKERSSYFFSHNDAIARTMHDFIKGNGQVDLRGSGYTIVGKDGSRLVMSSELKKGGAISYIVSANDKACSSAMFEGSKKSLSEEGNKILDNLQYNKKLELLEQIIQSQRQLLLKLIDEPKIISGD